MKNYSNPFYQKIRFRPPEVALWLIAAVGIFFLNESIYYTRSASFIINIAIFFSVLFLFYFRKPSFFFFLFASGFVINTRPREIHLIPIEQRGDFEYFAFNIQSFGLFTFGTTLLSTIGLLLVGRELIKLKIKRGPEFFIIVTFVLTTFSSLVFALLEGSIYLGESTNAVRYLFLLVSGVLCIRYFLEQFRNDDLVLILIKQLTAMLIVSMACTVFYLIKDMTLSEFKLRYTTSSIYFVPLLFFIALNPCFTNKFRIFVPSFGLILFFPLSRGEQLILIVSFLLYFFLSFSKFHNKTWVMFWTPKVIQIVGAIAFSFGAYYIYQYLPGTWDMIEMKFKFFLSDDLTHDQSSSVRVAEYMAIFAVDDFKNIIYLLLGRGAFGYFELHPDIVSVLNKSDYPAYQIIAGKFFSTHSFLSYYVLKFGLLGAFLIFFFYLRNLRIRVPFCSQSNLLLLLFLPGLIYMSYFSPMYAFLGSCLIGVRAYEVSR